MSKPEDSVWIAQTLSAVPLAHNTVNLAGFMRASAHEDNVTTVRLQLPFYWYNLANILQELFAGKNVKFVLEYKISAHITLSLIHI